MIEAITTEDAAAEAATPRAFPTKIATVTKLLSRNRGATVPEIMAITSWQPHSVRAFLTGLRKKGHMLLKEERKGGDTSYRLGA
jgi:hypothetical protein